MDVQQYNATVAAADAENPSGAWAGAPSLAASTVAMKNTSGHPVWVDVIGGTVTAVKVDGVTTGFTSGSFRLRRGSSIAITYSVAPTLGWFYENSNQQRPSGVWSGAPSLAASTVAMVNSSGYPVLVGISGGTFTVVTVDGVALTGVGTSTTPTTRVRLRRGSTLAITYSSAPTLQWLYE